MVVDEETRETDDSRGKKTNRRGKGLGRRRRRHKEGTGTQAHDTGHYKAAPDGLGSERKKKGTGKGTTAGTAHSGAHG